MSVEALITEHLDTWTGAVQRRNATGRGSSKKIELYGVKKLRELILELAVRGRLVPQDAEDEPAEVLLERIAAEKARLVAKGKIKKPKVLPPIAEDEKPFELPEGWAWERLGAISHLITDGAHHTPAYVEEGVPFLSVKDMSSGKLDFGNTRFISPDQHLELCKRCNPQKGDLLLTKVGTTGIPVLIDTDVEFSLFVSVALIKFPIYEIDGNFLSWLIKSPLVKKQSEEGTEGVGNKNLVLRKISAFTLAIPPLQEQHRIVAKVNELMQLCDQLEQATETNLSAHETLVSCLLDTLTQSQNSDDLAKNWQILSQHFDTLFTTEASIDQLKQTILQLAVMGKLVPQDPDDEPASVLLERIAAEKTRLVKEKKIKKQKVLPEITEEEMPFELPEGWAWCQLGELFLSFSNGLYKPSKYYHDDGIASLRMFNIQDGKINFDGVRRLDASAEEVEQYSLDAGDLLINRVNSKELVGKTAVVPCVQEVLLYESMNMRAKPLKGLVNSDYINIFMMSKMAKECISSFAKEAIGQASINQGQVSSILVPLPPLKEKQRIFLQVKYLNGICDQLKTNLTQAQQTQLKLTDTLVEQAL